MTEWRNAKTEQPKQGVTVIACNDRTATSFAAVYLNGSWYKENMVDGYPPRMYVDVNHWKPMPPAIGVLSGYMGIEELNLSVRAYHALKRAHIDTIGQLFEKSDNELLKIRMLGQGCLDEIKKRLSEVAGDWMDEQ